MRASPSFLYTSFYIVQFLFLGMQLPFLPGWMEGQGFTEKSIGIVIGASLVLRLVLGPVVAYRADMMRDQRIMLGVVTFGMASSVILMMLDQPLYALSLWVILMMFCFGCLVPLTDTAVLRADRAQQLVYGKARSIGSVAFIVASLTGGVLMSRYGYPAWSIWMVLSSVAIFAVALLLPKTKSGGEGQDQAEGEGQNSAAVAPSRKPKLSEARQLLRSKSFLLLLLASGLIQGAHATYYYFTGLHWQHIGYDPYIIGMLWSIGVLAEIILLYFAHKLKAYFSPVGLLMLGAGAAVIRWPLTGLSPPLGLLVLLQTLHAFTFAATYMGALHFIEKAVPDNLTNTAMTVVSTLGVGAVTGLAAVLVGQVFTAQQPFAGYALMGGMGVLAFLAAWALRSRWDGGLIGQQR